MSAFVAWALSYLLTFGKHGLYLDLLMEPNGENYATIRSIDSKINIMTAILHIVIHYYKHVYTLFSTSSIWPGPSLDPDRLLRLKRKSLYERFTGIV